MLRIPEVQVERKFRDPQERILAMLAFQQMREWSYQTDGMAIHGHIESAGLVYCNVKNGKIVWKFAFLSRDAALAFDAAFDPDHLAVMPS